jgi:hypothetical protein
VRYYWHTIVGNRGCCSDRGALATGDEEPQSQNDGENDESTKTYYSPFALEVRRREAHLDALPGKLPAEWFDSLNRASQVFSGNSVELVRHLSRFVGAMSRIRIRELPDGFDVEAN